MFAQTQGDESVFQLPIFLYIFVNTMLGDISSDPWVLLSLSVGAGSAVVYEKKLRLSVRAIIGRKAKVFVAKAGPFGATLIAASSQKFIFYG